jgi:RHS repeat-associated protein
MVLLAIAVPQSAAAQYCDASCGTPSITLQVPTYSTSATVQLAIHASDTDMLAGSSWKLWYKGVDVSSWIGTTGVITNSGLSWTSVIASGPFALDTGTHWLKTEICDANESEGPFCARDSVQVNYTPPPPPPATATPVVTLAQRSDARSLDSCATCASGTAAYSTPAFYFNGAARGASLVYSTELARPTGFVEVDVKVTATTVPSRLRIRLRNPGGSFVTMSNAATEAFVNGDTTTVRMAAQFDASGIATGAHLYNVLLTAFYPDTSMTDSVANVRVLVRNDADTAYGRGWTVAGDSRLHVQSEGSVLMAGDGSLAYYAFGSCGGSPWMCTYTSPTGDYSTLVRKVVSGDTVWTRTARDGTVSVWSPVGLLKSHTDRWGNLFAIERMATGDTKRVYRMKYETVVSGTTITKYITFAYSGTTGKLSSITLPDGRVSTFTVASGHLTTVLDPDNVTALTATYNSSRLEELAGRNGAAVKFTYDSFGQISRLISAAAVTDSAISARDTTTIVSLRAKLLTGLSTTVGASAPNAVRVDSAYLKVTTAQGTETKTVGWISGAPSFVRTQSLSGAVDEVRATYNASHQPVTTSGTGRPLQRLEWSGPRLVATENVGSGLREEVTYTGYYDQVDEVTVGGTVMLKHFYSGSNLAPDSTRSDSANVTRFTYDSRGRPLTVRDANSVTVTTTYETTHANVSTAARTGGSSTSITYDGSGRPQSVTDPASRTFTTYRDKLNRDTLRVGPLADSTRWTHNDVTGTYTVRDAIQQLYTTVVNARGWVTSQTDPRGNAESFAYDRRGRLTRSTGRRGDVITSTYDGMDRMTMRIATLSGLAPDTTTFTYDPAKLWVAVRNAESIDTFFVDAGARPTRTSTVRAGKHFEFVYGFEQSDLVNRTIVRRAGYWADTTGLGFDGARRSYRIEGFDGKVTTTLYDRSGREVRDTLPTSSTASAKVRKQITQSTAGPVWEIFANASSVALDRHYGSHDQLDRIESIVRYTATFPVGRAHTYDTLGRLQRFTDRQQQVTSWEMVYEEDPYGDCPGCWILTDSIPTYATVTLDSAEYAYDKVANRTGAGITISTGNRMTAYDGWAITYDSAGFMTRRAKGADTLTYSWNALGQLVQVTSKTPAYTVKYGYDGLGRRVRKVVGTDTTRYLVEGDRVLVDLDNSWAAAAKYSYYPGTDRPHAVRRGNVTYYFAQDVQGNITGLLDSTGTVVQEYNYRPFGEAQADAGSVVNPYRYKGREWDNEARLYFMRARYYDPQLGRFISEDPIGLAGGINPMAFVGGEPVNRADPSGLDCVLWGNYRVRYADGEEVSRTPLSTFWVGECDGIGESENGYASSPPFASQQAPPVGACGPILTQPGVVQMANRIWNRYLNDPKGREHAERLLQSETGRVYGVGLPPDYLSQTTTGAQIRAKRGDWGIGHTHPQTGRGGLIGDYMISAEERGKFGPNKIVVTADSLYLIPRDPAWSFGRAITEACARRGP